MYHSTEILAELENNLSGIKLTPPQAAVIKRIKAGWKLISVNQHHQSGGTYMWIRCDDNILSLDYAGSVYKAFWNVNYKISLKTGKRNYMGETFVSRLNNVQYKY